MPVVCMHAIKKNRLIGKYNYILKGIRDLNLQQVPVERLCRFPLEVLTFGVPVGRRFAVRMLDLGIPLGLGVLL